MSSSTPLPLTTVAQDPFNDDTADVVLRSSDAVDFYVHKIILSVASPFFKQMFSLHQPPSEHPANEDQGLTVTVSGSPVPVVPISEGSATMDYLLRLCYPVTDPRLPTEVMIAAAHLEAAVKYELKEATDLLRNTLRTFIAAEPLRVYVVACRLRLEDEASLAAHTFRQACPWPHSKRDRYSDWTSGGETVSAHRTAILLASGGALLDRIPEGETSEGLPILPVEEDAVTIANLLYRCYPPVVFRSEPRQPSSLELHRVWAAAEKYKINYVAGSVKDLIIQRSPSNLGSYFISLRNGWSKEAKASAIKFVKDRDSCEYVTAMEFCSADALYHLLRLRCMFEESLVDLTNRYNLNQYTFHIKSDPPSSTTLRATNLPTIPASAVERELASLKELVRGSDSSAPSGTISPNRVLYASKLFPLVNKIVASAVEDGDKIRRAMNGIWQKIELDALDIIA
ncbi:hypothetical protein EIP91_007562 [Steccherinum ochraceum]|uniref:BTB domain-containing protein n=1 Tax=Steccherinum ochraceum TaxID=92696 RepID=A0A4V2MXB1_9APHY|nr:hypothetical protein EIP91_007562 [Steccherinum ochraceum]